MTNHKQVVIIKNSKSAPTTLICGVPQGTILGLDLFNIYFLSFGDIIHSHGISYQIYVDDKQAYVPFKPTDLDPNLFRLNKMH